MRLATRRGDASFPATANLKALCLWWRKGATLPGRTSRISTWSATRPRTINIPISRTVSILIWKMEFLVACLAMARIGKACSSPQWKGKRECLTVLTLIAANSPYWCCASPSSPLLPRWWALLVTSPGESFQPDPDPISAAMHWPECPEMAWAMEPRIFDSQPFAAKRRPGFGLAALAASRASRPAAVIWT